MPPLRGRSDCVLPALRGSGRLDHDVGVVRLAGCGAELERQRPALAAAADDVDGAPLRVGDDTSRGACPIGPARARSTTWSPDVDDVEHVECARERLDERRDLGREARRGTGWRLTRAIRSGTTISSA